METKPPKSKILLQFSALYFVSIALVLLIAFYFLPRSSSQNIVSTDQLLTDDNEAEEKVILAEVESISKAYLSLKESDKENLAATNAPDEAGRVAQSRLEAVLDSVARVSRSYDAEQSLRLQKFVEAFRLSLSDRSAMNAYRTAMLSSSNTNDAQSTIVKLQAQLQSKNEQIESLNYELANASKNNVNGTPPGKQQGDAELTATIVAQQKKIVALTADVKTLTAEKNRRLDNNETDLKNQSTLNTILEQKVNQLTTDLRIAQADCNITRADGSKIISNSKQRKQLLTEALGILNNLSATGDAVTRGKVADKIKRLNSVASAVHD